jgi:hypothetical protein
VEIVSGIDSRTLPLDTGTPVLLIGVRDSGTTGAGVIRVAGLDLLSSEIVLNAMVGLRLLMLSDSFSSRTVFLLVPVLGA